MIIGVYYGDLEVHRIEKVVYGWMKSPHRVLSTCRANGGLREDITYLYNHQSCEPKGHSGIDLCAIAVNEPRRYHARISRLADIPDATSAGLGTAANMNNTAIAVESFRDLEVVAVSTAGVASNAARAGDPAAYWQSDSGCEPIDLDGAPQGTINTMLFISEELTPGALVSAATVMTEAKAGLLQELSVPSRYSPRIATGTGTDQIGIACRMGTSVTHTDANKHSKLGELIALAIERSLREALNLQGGVTVDSCRSCIRILERFGETADSMRAGVKAYLPDDAFALFESNFLSVNHDPLAVAATQAWAHLRDQIDWGVLPAGCSREILARSASAVALAVSGKPMAAEALLESMVDYEKRSPVEVLYWAFATGFKLKWEGRFED